MPMSKGGSTDKGNFNQNAPARRRANRLKPQNYYPLKKKKTGRDKCPEGTATGGSETDAKPDGIPDWSGYS